MAINPKKQLDILQEENELTKEQLSIQKELGKQIEDNFKARTKSQKSLKNLLLDISKEHDLEKQISGSIRGQISIKNSIKNLNKEEQQPIFHRSTHHNFFIILNRRKNLRRLRRLPHFCLLT